MKAIQTETMPLEQVATQLPASAQSTTGDAQAALQTNRLLQSVEPQRLKDLIAKGEWTTFRTGDVVSAQGLEVESIVFIASGRGKAEIAAPGREKYRAVVNFLGPGDDIGLLSLVDGGTHSASVIALESLETLSVPVGIMQEYLVTQPEWYRVIAEIAVSRLRTSGLWMQALI